MYNILIEFGVAVKVATRIKTIVMTTQTNIFLLQFLFRVV
jgi:hypothetical protein